VISLVVVGVLVLVGALAALGALNSGLEARTAAGDAISSAQIAWDSAQLAVEPGSPEYTESQDAAAGIAKAKSLFDSGYYVFADKYRAAQQEADRAGGLASGILGRVEALNSEAEAAIPSDAIPLYFDLAKRYPRTTEGQAAIDAAAQALQNDTYTDDIQALESVAAFAADCPGEVPDSVYQVARDRVSTAARDSIASQRSIVSDNLSWATAMKKGHVVYSSAGGTYSSDTAALSSLISKLSAAGVAEYKDALVLIRDSSKLGEKCRKTANSPVRRKGSISYFTRGQVNSIQSNSKKMRTKLNSADAKLKSL
jgi:hypothetical protein